MTSEQAQAYLTEIESAYYSGVLEVEYQGKRTRFQSMLHMERAIARLQRRIAGTTGKKRKRQAKFSKGFD